MTRLRRPRLCVGLTAISLLMGCGAEDDPADGAAEDGTGGFAAGLAGSGVGGVEATTGGSVNGVGGSGPSGGASSAAGGMSSGGSSVIPGSGGAPPAAGGASSGGIETAVGGGVPSSGGAGTGGDATGIGGASTGGTTVGTGGASTGGATVGAGGSATGGDTGTTGGTAGTGGAQPTTGGSAGAPGEGGSPAAGGSAGGGGTTGGDTVCGTAAEDEGVILSCGDDEVIDSVVFASYGTPSGECGSFATGDCHATTSESAVSSACVGRRSCTVAASNSTFGDPCSSTVKSLAVEVSCVVGEPTVTGEPFKGIANSPASEIAALGATWCYNWETSPRASDCGDPLFVPMVWGDGDVAAAIQQIGNAGYTTVLGFNEPNKTDQANMTVQRAIELWPDMTSDPNIRVGSPAVSDDGRAWLEDFMNQVQTNGLRVDFVAMHWYGWNAGSCTAGALEGAINWAQQWSLPVWITEFGCMGSSNPDEQTLLDFFPAAVAMIAGHPLVERYAWYPWNDYNHLYLDSVITPLGALYAAAPQTR